MGKVCFTCAAEKPLDEFGRRTGRGGGGPTSSCKACVSQYNAAYRVRNLEKCQQNGKDWHAAHIEYNKHYTRVTCWASTLEKNCRRTAKLKGYAFELDVAFIESMYANQQGRCYWLGIEMKLSPETRNLLQPSVDRVDCTKGYTRDNVVLTCQFANLGRSNVSADRFREFVAKLTAHFEDKAPALIDMRLQRAS